MFFSSIKEINRLLSKRMSHLLLRKADVLKSSISRKENLMKCTSFEEQKGLFGDTFILALSSSAVFRLLVRFSDFF